MYRRILFSNLLNVGDCQICSGRSYLSSENGLKKMKCRSCHSESVELIVSLGETTIADRLLTEDQLKEVEPKAPLDLFFCGKCALVQIEHTIAPDEIFDERYPYFSSVIPALVEHARVNVKELIRSRNLNCGSFVLEIGSNDGYLLRHFVEDGIEVLGIDPCQGPAGEAVRSGVPTRVNFFDRELAARLVQEGKRADVVIANNVLAHVPDLNGFVEGIKLIMKPEGVVVIEVPHGAADRKLRVRYYLSSTSLLLLRDFAGGAF